MPEQSAGAAPAPVDSNDDESRMKEENMKRFARSCLLGLGLALAATTFAQNYPDHPVHIIVPYPPGGNVDISARIIAQALEQELGQSFVVENKAGAAGFIGAEYVVRSKPDGYTLLVSSNAAISIAPLTNPNAPYEPLRDFTPIGMLAQTPMVVEVNPSLPVKSVAELVAYAKAHPGQVTMATPSAGSINHMAISMFELGTRTKFNLVHYKGNSPAVNDLLGGHVQASFDQVTSSLQHIKSGKLRALAVTSPHRAPELPDVPTLAEAGYKGLEAVTFTAVVGPRGLPPEVVTKLNTAVNKALQQQAVKDRFAAAGAQVHGTTPEEFGAFLKAENVRWSKVIKEANIKVQ
jgi:tripartite-type tricarboxylate transporter receptor subunit TctC